MPHDDRFPAPNEPDPSPTSAPDARSAVDERRAELLAIRARVAADGPFEPEWSSLQEVGVPDWFRDAKFGVFIHWLVASVPAFRNEWYARDMYLEGSPEYEHHLETYGPHVDFGFKDFIPDFTGERFDAAEWISMIRRSGAKYVVPVAEHHDGFALYDSGLTGWKATAMGPRRDVIAELAAEARRQGLTFGLSSHRAENWWFFNGGTRFESDVTAPENAGLYGRARPIEEQPDEAFLDDWLSRLTELVENYDPQLVWFDWWIEQPAFEPHRRAFAAYLYNRSAARGGQAVINYKWDAFPPGAAVYDVERGAVRGIEERVFQNDSSTSRIAWVHIRDNDYKSVAELIGELLDVVSKNGSLLLNVGPRPDGSFTDEDRAILEGIGSWMDVNGEAIFGTRPWVVYGEGPTHPPVGSFADGAPVSWTGRDIRYTRRENTIYASYFTWPDAPETTLRTFADSLRIFEGEVTDVALLGATAPVEWRVDDTGLHVALPAERPHPLSPVLRIETAPAARVERHEPGFAV